MDFEAMKTFVAVVDQKSFTRAAASLNLSQPTVSSHIKNLERYFDATLIDRSPKRFHLTKTGEIVYQRSRQAIGLIDKAVQEVSEYQRELGGLIRIGASYTVGEYILPPILKAFDQAYPSVDLQVRIENSKRINEAVQHHDLDVGLIEGKVTQHGLSSEPFMEDEMVVLVPEAHPIRKQSSITFADLQDQTWITREEGSGTRAMMDSMLESFNIRPKKMITIGSNHGVVQGVKAGLGLSFLSKTVVCHTGVEHLIMQLPYIKTTTRYFSIVTPMNREEISDSVDKFMEEVRALHQLSKNY